MALLRGRCRRSHGGTVVVVAIASLELEPEARPDRVHRSLSPIRQICLRNPKTKASNSEFVAHTLHVFLVFFLSVLRTKKPR